MTTLWYHIPYSIVSVGQNTLLVIPPMHWVKASLKCQLLYFLPPGSLLFLQFSHYFCLKPPLKPSSWSIFSMKPFLAIPNPFLYSFSHLLLSLIHLPPSHESVATWNQGKGWGTFLSPVSAGHTAALTNTPLKCLTTLMEPTGPRSAVHFKSLFTKHQPDVRCILSL